MDGFVEMTQELVDLLIFIVALAKEIVVAIMGESDFGKFLHHLYEGLTGVTNWLGYAVAALFYLAEEDETLAEQLCEAANALYVLTDGLHGAVAFSDAAKNDKKEQRGADSTGYEVYKAY